MKNFRKLPLGCALACVYFLAAGRCDGQVTAPAPNRITQAPDNSSRITLKGGVHPLARAEFSRGAVADSLPMDRILLLLRRSDEQEVSLQSLLEAQQDKSSPNYHQWLTPEMFGKQFGPSDADIQSVTDWLAREGFHGIHLGPGRSVIEFSGTADQVRQAFSTQMQNYAVNGAMYIANSSDPQIPAALAPVISGIVSLHNFPRKSHSKLLGDVRRNPNTGKLEPLFTFPFPGNGQNFYGVAPGDFATIYNSKALVGGGNDGTGQTIAIVGETQIDPSDVSDFRAMFGLANNFSAANVILNGMDPGITSEGEETESDLDVQWSGAVAPGATVKFVVSASTPASAGIDLSALYIIEHNLADVMSESYGDCEADLGSAGNAFYNSLWEQAAAQGITVVVSSGDGGAAGCDDFNSVETASQGIAVSGIAGTPYNVSVGGTDFNQTNTWVNYWNSTNDSSTGTSAKGYIPEIPWSETCAQLGLTGCGSTAPNGSLNIIAGSGGPSKVYAKPKWQMGVNGVPNDNHRDQPDISLFASPGFTGSAYVICQKDVTGVSSCDLSSPFYSFHTVGGTSASAPAFAGVMAIVNQYAAAHGGSSRQGNPNPVLYALAKKSGASCTSSTTEGVGCMFNDVAGGSTYLATRYGKSVGTNSVPCKGGTPNCSSTAASANGVLVDPSHTTTEAWTAATGYDMATGLGSLNIGNLATNWGSASTIATTTTLSLSPTTGITHGTGENVAVTVNVTPKTGSGVASGDVSLIATLASGATLGLDQFTLSNGSTSGLKTQSLPGGTYKVYAHYAGDGTNAPSDSPEVQVTVGKESSQTFIVIPTFDSQGIPTSGNAASLLYGSNYIIRMYVANSSAVASTTGPPSPTCETVNAVTCPTGTMTLTANGSPVDGGAYTLNNLGYSRDIAPTLTGGTYSLVAKYSGDNSYTSSTSATDTLTITPAPTSQQWTNYPGFGVIGQPFPLGVVVDTGVAGVAPTGTVTFFDGANPLTGTVTYDAQGQNVNVVLYANSSATISTGGSRTITAKYSGDASYQPSVSQPITFNVKYLSHIAVSQAQSINYGQSLVITAVMTGDKNGPLPRGNFLFYSSYTPITGTIATTSGTDANGNPLLASTVSTTPQNSETICVNYSNDPNYTDASAPCSFVTVDIPDFSMSPSSGFNIVATAGQPGSAQITIAPASQTPSTVNLSLLSPVTIFGYTVSLSPAQVNLNNAPATATVAMTPTNAGPATAIRKSPRNNELPPALWNNSKWNFAPAWLGLVAAAAILLMGRSNRHRTLSLALQFSLAYIFIFMPGCGGGSGSTGGGGGGTNQAVPTTTTLVVTAAKITQLDSFTLSATVSGKGPSGFVVFYDYGQPTTAQIPVVNGVATYSSVGYAYGIGVHQFTAKYEGDANNLSSTSAASSMAVTGTTSISVVGATGGDQHYLSGSITIQ